jgi:hypothetical protein
VDDVSTDFAIEFLKQNRNQSFANDRRLQVAPWSLYAARTSG